MNLPAKKMVLGVHTFAVAPFWDLEVMRHEARRLKSHGVGLLEIPLLRPEEINIKATRAFAREFGFELVTSLGLPSNIDAVEDPQSALAFLEPAFKVAAEIGSNMLSGVTYAPIGKISGQPVTQREKDGICRFLQQAAALAANHGLKLGVEPCNRYETHLMNTAAQAVEYVEAVAAENLFIHLDTYHMNIEEESFAAGFAKAAPYLGYVHLSESNRGVPGRAMINWDAVMGALADIGYHGALTLESMNYVDPDIATALAVWRPVAKNPDDVIDFGLAFLLKAAADAGLTFG
ncbi:D-tagatose 3-epimerase [hydrothermal vent metagenome]|uniref:D-tagatose 3-epimerase n=1 Tax=hydrothermal vent metagenome TaxID=652676 RepID=A0A3B0U8Z0_9ZZZZ